MATVYLTHDLRHDRRVAVKVLRPEVTTAIGAERFLREIKVAARLQHPHILPLHDSGVAGDSLYYVMPYVAGETLRARLQRERQLPLAEEAWIARDVADALTYAHDHGVAHRDVEPENNLPESGHAVVSDFGIPRALARRPLRHGRAVRRCARRSVAPAGEPAAAGRPANPRVSRRAPPKVDRGAAVREPECRPRERVLQRRHDRRADHRAGSGRRATGRVSDVDVRPQAQRAGRANARAPAQRRHGPRGERPKRGGPAAPRRATGGRDGRL